VIRLKTLEVKDMFEPETAFAIRGSSRAPLVIGLVNNMPDLALRATERQFCALLSAASRDFVTRLKLFSLPEITRSDTTRAHIKLYYDNIAELKEDPPDGLIVTGTEPRSRHLKDEPYWHALSGLAGWAEDRAIPTVWSCLAAHAAVLHLEGIERQRLGSKLSGVFDCQIDSASHEVVHGTPAKWRVPHSRSHGLSEEVLQSHGYSIVSWSPETGADIFLKESDSLSLFFQGHPEYSTTALLGEYRRDISRFLSGEEDFYPQVPHGYFSANVEVELGRFRERALFNRNPELMNDFAQLVTRSALADSWFSTAVRIYANWLLLLSDRRRRGQNLSTSPIVQTESSRSPVWQEPVR
jgi:homoserine O-succinyltransferase/O-acetyltransferase